jgi:hypothetical protein
MSTTQITGKKRLRRHDANTEDDVVMIDQSVPSSFSSTSSTSLLESFIAPNVSKDQPASLSSPPVGQPLVRREAKRSRLRRHDACEGNQNVGGFLPSSSPTWETAKQQPCTDDWLCKEVGLSPQSNSSLDIPKREPVLDDWLIPEDRPLRVSKKELVIDDWSTRQAVPARELNSCLEAPQGESFIDDWLSAIQL